MRLGCGSFMVALALAGLACGSTEKDKEVSPDQEELPTLIADLCAVLPQPCAPADCMAGLNRELEEAVDSGCTGNLADWLECLSSAPMSCESSKLVAANPTCAILEAEYRLCSLKGSGCASGNVVGSGYESCEVHCAEVGAECEGDLVGPVSCTCTTDGKTSQQFSVPHCLPPGVLVLELCGFTPAGL